MHLLTSVFVNIAELLSTSEYPEAAPMNSPSIWLEELSRPGNVDLSSWFSLVDLFSTICFVVVDDTKFTLTTSWLVKLCGFEFNSITFNTSVPATFSKIFLETWDIVWYFSWGVDISLFYRIIDFTINLMIKTYFNYIRCNNSTFLYLVVETAPAFIRRIRFYIYKVLDDFTILITTMGPSTELSTWHMGVTWKFSPSVMIFSRTTVVSATTGQIIFAGHTILIFMARNNFTKTNSTICQSWAEIEEWSCLIIWKYNITLFVYFL